MALSSLDREMGKAWMTWRGSGRAEQLREGSAKGEYLDNRLCVAFHAGCEAGIRVAEERLASRMKELIRQEDVEE